MQKACAVRMRITVLRNHLNAKFWGVFHLPRDSGNSGWVVNGTRFSGLFHWKISGKSGTSEKVVPFSVPFTGFAKVYQFQAAYDHIFGKEIWRLLPQLARWLPSPPLSTNAQSVMALLLI